MSHVASYGIAPLLRMDFFNVISVALLVLVLLTGLQKDMPVETVQAASALLWLHIVRSWDLTWSSFYDVSAPDFKVCGKLDAKRVQLLYWAHKPCIA